MRVRYTAGACCDLREIFAYLQLDAPAAAEAVLRRIDQRIGGLSGFPRQGRPAGGDRRELVIAGTPYLAIYRIARDEVQVLPFSTADGGGPDRVPPSRSQSMKAGGHGRRRCEKILSGRA